MPPPFRKPSYLSTSDPIWPKKRRRKLEFMFFRVLENSEYRMPNLAARLACSPGLYAEAVVRVFKRGDNGEDPPELRIEDTEQRKAVATAAYHLLQWVHRIPGSDARGAVDTEAIGGHGCPRSAHCAGGMAAPRLAT